jgi:hypothetical protein
MKSFLLIGASIISLTFGVTAASAWDGDDHGSSRRRTSDDSYNRGSRGGDDTYDRHSDRRRDDSYTPRRDRSPPIYVGKGRIYVDRDHDGIEDHYDTYDNRTGRRPPWTNRDRDRDGIPDRNDPYPNQAGFPDRDHDGIPDSRDTYDNRRPPPPTGYGGYPDRDRDGIPDWRDSRDNRRNQGPYDRRDTKSKWPDDTPDRTKRTGGGDDGRVKQPWEQNAEKAERERQEKQRESDASKKKSDDGGWKEKTGADAPWGSKENPGYGGKP